MLRGRDAGVGNSGDQPYIVSDLLRFRPGVRFSERGSA